MSEDRGSVRKYARIAESKTWGTYVSMYYKTEKANDRVLTRGPLFVKFEPPVMSTPTSDDSKKLILVIGATGAQGLAVVDKLLAPCEDGSPSPYAVRALTRNPQSQRAKALAEQGVEIVQGKFDDFDSVAVALKGAYGAWINTDGFTVGIEKEVWCGIRIYELARQARIKHYVWSSLDYASKLMDFNPIYRCEHSDGKGIVADFLKSQPSVVSDTDMSWTIVTSGPYMDMLQNIMFGPLKRRIDGTVVFAMPIKNGHAPMIALSDLGFFARYTFDNREGTSGQDLSIASDWVGWEYLKSTFERVTGQKAEIIHQSLDEWFENFERVDYPIANERTYGDGSTTWKENFQCWWAMWRDDVVKKDYDWIRKVNPKGHTLESWMREQQYGPELFQRSDYVLKNVEEGKGAMPNWERIDKL
ncbi:NAD(P)-binding protein [Laetiporus sulphureus 93-53]|uniref:NAD(P)-binding protein n=1 Tax=Laetiporus sulphureus 93-53 TaxID=1314785 RepID=A0A165B4L0_9APHY|nr:NAD(P)-binding protein [Laetiporus sulphureus 93-53]KZT00222.1 NAD(P)-binding protein [Laetiporus sulphureus 93-53]